MLEPEAAFMYGDIPANANSFVNRICDLENCVVRRYNPGMEVSNHLLLFFVYVRIIR